MKLRTAVGMFTVIGTVFALLVSGALIWLTSVMHHATVTIADGAESVHLAETAQTQLLLHRRARDPVARAQIAVELRRRLRHARRYVRSGEEVRMLREARRSVERLLRLRTNDQTAIAAAEARAFAALARVVEETLSQTREANARAARLDDIANVVGIGGGAMVFLVSMALLLWVRARAFDPVLTLGATMERFARGDTAARAPETGPGELREMAERFNEMAAAIAAQRQAQTAFLGGVAHDLRNPLQSLKLAAGMVGEIDPEVGGRLDRPLARLERMIGDFLDAAKIEAGQLALRIQTHDARASVQHVSELFEGASEEHALDVDVPATPLFVRCDPLRLEQSLTNLVSNAIKYSPEGGRVDFSLRRLGGDAIFEVSDQGIGISADDQRHLFEPFRRVGLSREAIPGVGLGLYVVRQIVEAHGGRIEVSSAPGRGSTFRILLPAITPARAKEEPTPAAAPQLRNA